MVIEMLGGGVWLVSRINATARLRIKAIRVTGLRTGATW